MSTLEAGESVAEVAEILYAAVLLGPAGWGREDFSQAGISPNMEQDLRQNLLDLFALLHGRNVSYLLVGGIAMLTYVDGRNTKDVGLVLSVESLEQLSEIKILDRNRDFARGLFNNLRVHILFTDNPLFKLVQQNYATVHRFLETDVRCVTVEGLILLKLYALRSLYRQGDGQRIGLYENDIFMLCQQHRPNIEPLFGILATFVDSDQLRELRNIVADIDIRIRRIERMKVPPTANPLTDAPPNG